MCFYDQVTFEQRLLILLRKLANLSFRALRKLHCFGEVVDSASIEAARNGFLPAEVIRSLTAGYLGKSHLQAMFRLEKFVNARLRLLEGVSHGIHRQLEPIVSLDVLSNMSVNSLSTIH